MASINKYSAFESYWSYFDEELKLEDTKSVLKQYALDISNPFSDPQLAYANKDLSENIFSQSNNCSNCLARF